MNDFTTGDGATPIDPSHLVDKTIKTREQLFQAEFQNVNKATRKYLAARPTQKMASFEFAWLLKLNQEMFGEVWKWAGTIRTTDLNIGVPYYNVQTQLQDLLETLRYWRKRSEISLLEQAVRLHHRAVWIHPFLNGNGRWSRMLSNIWLAQHDHPIVMWPEATLGFGESTIRQDYLKACRSADAGDFTELISLHRSHLVDR